VPCVASRRNAHGHHPETLPPGLRRDPPFGRASRSSFW
jgi:hypothetical protein